MLLLALLSSTSTRWEELAHKLAVKIYKESRGDYYDVNIFKDSTGIYLMYHSSWYVLMPSGYKMWYRTPIALKLPDDTPDDFIYLLLVELDEQGKKHWKERLGELLASSSGCGLAVVGWLAAVMFSLRR